MGIIPVLKLAETVISFFDGNELIIEHSDIVGTIARSRFKII